MKEGDMLSDTHHDDHACPLLEAYASLRGQAAHQPGVGWYVRNPYRHIPCQTGHKLGMALPS